MFSPRRQIKKQNANRKTNLPSDASVSLNLVWKRWFNKMLFPSCWWPYMTYVGGGGGALLNFSRLMSNCNYFLVSLIVACAIQRVGSLDLNESTHFSQNEKKSDCNYYSLYPSSQSNIRFRATGEGINWLLACIGDNKIVISLDSLLQESFSPYTRYPKNAKVSWNCQNKF